MKTRNIAVLCLLLTAVTSAALVASPAPASAAASAQPSSATVPGPAQTPMPGPLAAFLATLTPTAAPAIPGLPPGAIPATCTQAKCFQNPGPSCDQVCDCTLKAFCNFTTCTLVCHCAPPCHP